MLLAADRQQWQRVRPRAEMHLGEELIDPTARALVINAGAVSIDPRMTQHVRYLPHMGRQRHRPGIRPPLYSTPERPCDDRLLCR
jgi:hypothetical protein